MISWCSCLNWRGTVLILIKFSYLLRHCMLCSYRPRSEHCIQALKQSMTLPKGINDLLCTCIHVVVP